MQHVDVRLNPIIYYHLLGTPISLDVLKGIDNVLYSSLNWMLANDVTDTIFETFAVTVVRLSNYDIILIL